MSGQKQQILSATLFGIVSIFSFQGVGADRGESAVFRICGAQAVRGISCQAMVKETRLNMQGAPSGTRETSKTVLVACGSNRDTHIFATTADAILDSNNAEAVGFSKIIKIPDASGRETTQIVLETQNGKWKARLAMDSQRAGRGGEGRGEMITGSLTMVRRHWLNDNQNGLKCSRFGDWSAEDVALEQFAGEGQNGYHDHDGSHVSPIPYLRIDQVM